MSKRELFSFSSSISTSLVVQVLHAVLSDQTGDDCLGRKLAQGIGIIRRFLTHIIWSVGSPCSRLRTTKDSQVLCFGRKVPRCKSRGDSTGSTAQKTAKH